MPLRGRPPSSLPGLNGGSPGQQPSPRQGAGGQQLSSNERFPKDFWLTPRTVLTRVTPISKLNHFCVRHGARRPPIAPSRRTTAKTAIS